MVHRRTRSKLVTVAVLAGVLAAACGGGKKASTATGAADTTSTSGDVTSTTAVTAPGETTSTTGLAGAPTSPTTAKRATSSGGTATKSSTATTAKKSTNVDKQVQGGITNVTSAPTTAASSNIQPGGTLVYLKASDALGFDPIVLNANSGADAPSSFAVFGALVYGDPSDGTVKPHIADSLTSSDGVVWTLKLKPNVKFTDGTPYDAAAVKFNWLRLQDPANKAARAASANLMQSIDVVDPLTLRLTLKAKNAVFPASVALIPYVGSPTAIQQRGADFNSNPVGAGPFILKSWQRDSDMVFVRNPGYFDAPRPYVDQMIQRPITDESQRANTMNSTPNSILFTVTPQTADQLKKSGQVEYAAVQNGGPNVEFNVRAGKKFADPRARKAVTEAIDRCDLIKVVLNNAVECEDSIFRHNSPYYDPTITQVGYNPTDAQALFDQLAAEQGGTFKFTLYTFQTGNFPAEGQYIQSKLNSYKNVHVDLESPSVNLMISNISSGNFEISIYSNPFDEPEPTWTSVFTCDNQSRFTGWCNTKFDAAVADNRVTLDPKQRVADLKEAQRQFYADIPAFYFERRVTWNMATSSIQDLQFVNDGQVLFDRVWIKQR
jgi:peptide/nickel transport system substrate-binding protein